MTTNYIRIWSGRFPQGVPDERRSFLACCQRATVTAHIDNTAAYIFILPKASVDGVKGDMPLTRPVGYVFASGDTYADGQTIAHELGHGLYSFQHAFDYMGVSQGETDNLMDYGLPQGEHLAVWQWNLISTHKNYTVPFLTDDEDGWISLTSAPQLVNKRKGKVREFYEKLINEMFDLNKEKYPGDFNLALKDLRDFVLGRDSLKLRFDLVVQYLYFTAGNDSVLKKTAKAYSLASAIILSTAANGQQNKLTLGPKNEFCTNDENGYDSKTTPQSQHISLRENGKDEMNFIALNNISGIKKWDGKGTLSDYYEKIETSDISEPCSFYTLLHECVHVLYYIKPDLSVIDMTQPNRCAGCLLKSQLNVEDLNPNPKDKDYAKKLAVLNEYRYFRKQVINLYFKKLNYDMAIKVENYFRVNLRKLDNSSENIFVRTSIGHLGTIINQEHIEGYYKKDCFKQWWDKKKGTYPSFFMDINEKLYTLTDDILQALDIMYISAITNNNGSKNGKIHRIVFTNGIEGLKKYNYWKDKYEGLKYKNIWKLE